MSVTLNFVESRSNTQDGYLYGFDKLPRALRGGKQYSAEESSKNTQIAGDINNSDTFKFGPEGGSTAKKSDSDADNIALPLDKVKPKFNPAEIVKLERKDLSGITAPVSIDIKKLPTLAPLRQNPDASKGNFVREGKNNHELWIKEDNKKYVATVYQSGTVKEKTKKLSDAGKAIDKGEELLKKYQ